MVMVVVINVVDVADGAFTDDVVTWLEQLDVLVVVLVVLLAVIVVLVLMVVLVWRRRRRW